MQELPTLWLLGKTAAGKSSLLGRVVGPNVSPIGDGINPCTRGVETITLPAEAPIMRIMDTRGLGEAGYDASADIAACVAAASAILVVARLDDPVQREVAQALGTARSESPTLPILLAFTGGDLVAPNKYPATQKALREALALDEQSVPSVVLSLAPDLGWEASGMPQLFSALANLLPTMALQIAKRNIQALEQEQFAATRPIVLRHARVAAGLDGVPIPVFGSIIGAVSVPGVQAAMLRRMAQHYDISWTRARIRRLGIALGVGTATRMGLGLLVRQMAKLVPVVGQTAGAAAAAGVSYGATYVLGRVAARFLYGESVDRPPSAEELKQHFDRELTEMAARIQRGQPPIPGASWPGAALRDTEAEDRTSK